MVEGGIGLKKEWVGWLVVLKKKICKEGSKSARKVVIAKDYGWDDDKTIVIRVLCIIVDVNVCINGWSLDSNPTVDIPNRLVLIYIYTHVYYIIYYIIKSLWSSHSTDSTINNVL